MYRIVKSALPAVLVMALCSGCASVEGTWVLRQICPPTPEGEYQIAKVCFYPNCCFEAIGFKGKEQVRTKGTYDYDPCTNGLTMMSGCDVQYYTACIEDDCLTIESCDPCNPCAGTTAMLARCGPCPSYCGSPARCSGECRSGCRPKCPPSCTKPCCRPCRPSCYKPACGPCPPRFDPCAKPCPPSTMPTLVGHSR